MNNLAIYDLSGIQSCIFSENKIKQIIGASQLVHQALFEKLPEILGESENQWSDECEKTEFTFKNTYNESTKEGTGKIVYIGGGNALAIFSDKETAEKKTDELKKKIFEISGGMIKVISAIDDGGSEDDSFYERYKKLRKKLTENKCSAIAAKTAPGFGINAIDNINYEPVLYFEDDKGSVCATRSSYLKLKDTENKDVFQVFAPKNTKFLKNFDECKIADSKNYIAVVHIDGNTMGKKINSVNEKNKGTNLYGGLDVIRKMSNQINNKYKETFKEAIAKIAIEGEATCPIRPVILDGDDITFICASKLAIKITQIFIDLLNEKPMYIGKDKWVLTVGAGIAFVKIGFPFSDAYEIAEQCCKNAKKKANDEGYKGDKNVSSFDFHMCYSGATLSVNEYRRKYYHFVQKNEVATEDCQIHMRPYLDVEDKLYSISEFNKMCEKVSKGDIPRSKLKGLRNAIGKHSAEDYYDFVGVSGTKLSKLVEKKNIYNSCLFDALDIMDITGGDDQ